MDSSKRAPDAACSSLMTSLFGDLPTLMDLLAPHGWELSPYVRIHHPSPEQQHSELTILYESMNRLADNRRADSSSIDRLTVPSVDEIRQKEAETPELVAPLFELLDVYGGCIWSVFSNNHEVIDREGTVYDLGSFRGTGSFLADFIEQQYPDAPSFTYMSFYCADLFIERRADVTPVYELIFKRLAEQEFDWIYSFPRTYAISFDSAITEPDADPAIYDPAKAQADELKRKQRQEETSRLQKELDRAAEEAAENARYQAPPMIVQAYRNVYGHFPQGWVNQ